MTELTHTSEDLLNKLRKGDFIADGKIIDILIEAHNAANTLLQRIKNHDLQPLNLDGTLEKFRARCSRNLPQSRLRMSRHP